MILLSLVENCAFLVAIQGTQSVLRQVLCNKMGRYYNFFMSSSSISCSVCADCHLPGTLCMWTDCTTCFESCAGAASECGWLGGAGEAGLPILLVVAIVVLGLFTIIGIFYTILVATMVGQRIWQRHYHILAKRMLTKVSELSHVYHLFIKPRCFPNYLLCERASTLLRLGIRR